MRINLLQFTKPIKFQCCPHIETSQLVCCANQLTGFYMRVTLAFKGLTHFSSVAFHIETKSNRITGFYIKYNTGLNGLKKGKSGTK